MSEGIASGPVGWPFGHENEIIEVHAMIDLETFGVGERAAVVQLGLALFTPFPRGNDVAIGVKWETNINLASALLHGGEIDASTVDFWRKRSNQWDALTQLGHTIPFVLDTLDSYFKEFRPTRTWCHGATFDVPILSSYYRRLERKTPWNFYDVRCTRTLFETATNFTDWERPQRETTHLGLFDAIDQANDVVSALGALKRTTLAPALT